METDECGHALTPTSRIVSKRCSQENGVGYLDVFTLALLKSCVKLIVGLAVKNDWEMRNFYVAKNAI